MCTPVRCSMAATTSLPLEAMRNPAVPTAAIVRTPCRFASSTMPAIAATVRSSAASTIVPALRESLAEAGHLGAVDDGAPVPAGDRARRGET